MTRQSLKSLVTLTAFLLLLSIPFLSIAQQSTQTIEPPAVAVPSGPQATAAAPLPKIDKGDTAWMLTSSALVLMMTIPGLFLFYGGLVRRKNVLGTIMHSFIIVAVISIQWALCGYTLAFGPDIGGIIGDLSWLGLKGVGPQPNADYAATIPHAAFMIYQMMFAVITPALITGALPRESDSVRLWCSLFSGRPSFMILWPTGFGA